MTLGEKIQKLRKQQGLSQEALAEKVTVTRQTISKWELGQSLPDLDFIAQLSEIFNVSSDYLIKDEMVEPDEPLYKKRSYRLSERGKRIIWVIVSATALIAGCVCLICDYFTSDRLSWSLIAAVSIIAGWFMLLPSLISRTKIVLKTLVVVSVIPFPLLAILSLLLKKSVISWERGCNRQKMKTVLLHGLGQTAQDWKDVVCQLSVSNVECPELFSSMGNGISDYPLTSIGMHFLLKAKGLHIVVLHLFRPVH